MPWIAQGPGDCGAACLTAVLRDRGRRVELGDVLRVLPRRQSLATLLDLQRAARQLGLDMLGAYAADPTAAVLTRGTILRTRGLAHFVVYVGRRRGRVYLLDPAIGPVFTAAHDLHRHVTGHLLLTHRRRRSERCRS